jgi:UDP:flavonoid glycosyltransferase YjiC (YdhE family)
MEALREGVPLICMPIAHDQPSIAVRVQSTKVGVYIQQGDITLTQLTSLIADVVSDPRYRVNAKKMAEEIRVSGGVERAAQYIDNAYYSYCSTR